MSDDLVKRLRNVAHTYDEYGAHSEIELEAADRIAELEAALRKINDKDSYSRGSYGPFAEIARAALEGKKDE